MPIKQYASRSGAERVAIVGQPITTTEHLDSTTFDAFGRKRISGPGNRFDVEFIYDKQPLLVDDITAGSGTNAYQANSRDIVLSTGGSTAGDSASIYSHYDVPYTPGNSQLIKITGTLNETGAASPIIRAFVRSTTSGTTATTTYEQSTWDNPLSDVDWSKSQILVMDFQSLKVGRIRWALNRGGINVPFLDVDNDNVRSGGFWQRPTLPVYWRVYNNEVYSIAEIGYGDESNGIGIQLLVDLTANIDLRAICASVVSEGGAPLLEMPGFQFTADNGVTGVSLTGTQIPLLSIRPAALFQSKTNRTTIIPENFEVFTDQDVYYELIYRPTLTGASWTAVDSTHSAVQYDVTASAYSGGIVVASGYAAAGTGKSGSISRALDRVLLSLGRTGTADILTLTAVDLATNATTYGAINWKEIR